ncbi:MAG: hypothetical protein ACRD1L_05525, partial [Terriglobales bacterium]
MKARTLAAVFSLAFALALAAVPARSQVNLTRTSPSKICPTWGCGPLHFKTGTSAALPGAVSQAGLGPGADLHLEFPLFNRALPNRAQVQAVLVYDSLFWGPAAGAWQPAAGAGWWLRTAGGQLLESDQFDYGACGWNDGSGDDGSGEIDYYSFVLKEPDGTSRPIGTVMEASPPYGRRSKPYYWDCPHGNVLPKTFSVSDGKGFKVIVDGSYGSGVTGGAWDGYGDEIDNGLTDPNGNHMGCTASGCSDPLGSALAISGSGTPSSPVQYGYPGPGGATQNITVNYSLQYVQGSFGCYTNYAASVNLPASLVYPDGSTYSFTYDSAGRLAAVTLPSGGTFSYVHNLEPVNCASGAFSSFLGQWDPTMTHEWQWSHDPTANQTVQTDPYGNTTVFDFDSFGDLTEEDDWSGAYNNGGTELSSTAITYTGQTTAWTREVLGSPNLLQQHSQTLDGAGLVTAASDSDWYTAGTNPIPLLGQTSNTYAASGNGEVLTGSVVEDGGGATASETTFANYTNGNPGTENDFTSSGASLQTSFTYNSNGTIATETEPNGAVTTFGSYTCGSGFFPGSITTAIGAISMSWECNGALPTQVKDYNSQPTSVTYD